MYILGEMCLLGFGLGLRVECIFCLLEHGIMEGYVQAANEWNQCKSGGSRTRHRLHASFLS